MQRSILNDLQDIIRHSHAEEVSLSAHHLSTGEEVLLDADRGFHPASVIKLCIMLEAFHQARQGILSLDDPVLVKNEFVSVADGSPYSLDIADDSEKDLYDHIGERMPRAELVRRMVVASSNLATNLLIEDVTPRQINDFMRVLGADGLVVRRGVEDKQAYLKGLNNSGTARGFMQLLLALARGEVVSPQDSAAMIEILSRQQFNQMIPAQLPAGTRVAHKSGWLSDHYHDAGIVYPPDGQPFVLAILTKGYSEAEESAAHGLVASLAQAIYDHWNAR